MFKVFVIDRRIIIQLFKEALCQDSEIKFLSTTQLNKAVEQAKTWKPNLIFCKVGKQVEGTPGVSVIHRLKECLQDTEIIAMSGDDGNEEIARKLGRADHFLSKPFLPSDIRMLVETAKNKKLGRSTP